MPRVSEIPRWCHHASLDGRPRACATRLVGVLVGVGMAWSHGCMGRSAIFAGFKSQREFKSGGRPHGVCSRTLWSRVGRLRGPEKRGLCGVIVDCGPSGGVRRRSCAVSSHQTPRSRRARALLRGARPRSRGARALWNCARPRSRGARALLRRASAALLDPTGPARRPLIQVRE